MTPLRTRLVVLVIALPALGLVGAAVTGGISFALGQFWFTAGLLLLLLMSLVDQPAFSKDANVFLNGVTGGASLLLVDAANRTWLWWLLLIWCVYLVVSSYALMWIRSRPLAKERFLVQLVSRMNRQMGRPEAVFSALFLWGAILQFGEDSHQLSALFVFWAIYMIVDIPAVLMAIGRLFETRSDSQAVGVLGSLTSPRVAELSLLSAAPDLIGRGVVLTTKQGEAARGVVIDDRVVAGKRVGRLAITSTAAAFRALGEAEAGAVPVQLVGEDAGAGTDLPTSVVDAGSEIGKVVFHVHPDSAFTVGELVRVRQADRENAYYQTVSAVVAQRGMGDGNELQTVKVTAGQVGVWSPAKASFEPVTWVVPAGELIYRASRSDTGHATIPDGSVGVGVIPKSSFPVYVRLDEAITLNTAVIGITGSGKSYLAFHLIEAIASSGVKVMVLDMSRQHDAYLAHLDPTPLHEPKEVEGWMAGESPIGIHQFALDRSFPAVTAAFVLAAFGAVSQVKPRRGVNLPPRLCVVFEEAHSLIPEWNQVAEDADKNHVNRTARLVLQGRKYGMGCMVITQRTANVTKTILNQCSTVFALQSYDQTGLDFLRNYMGEEYAQAISTLPRFHSILVGKASSSARPIIFQLPDWQNRWTETTASESEATPLGSGPFAPAPVSDAVVDGPPLHGTGEGGGASVA